MAQGVPLPRLSLDGDLKSNWAKFRQLWDSYELVTGLKDKDDKIRVATFVTAIGSEALDIHINLPYESDDDRQKMLVVLQLWDTHCPGATNVIYERFKCNNCTQGSDSFDAFVVRLCSLANSCDFGQLRDSLIRDQLVCGVTDTTPQKRLLQESNLTLEGCIKIGHAYYATKQHLKDMTKSDESVSFAKKTKKEHNYMDAQPRVIHEINVNTVMVLMKCVNAQRMVKIVLDVIDRITLHGCAQVKYMYRVEIRTRTKENTNMQRSM